MMNKLFVLILILSSTLYGLAWEKDLETALENAKESNKNVMVLVESKRCGWCQKLKSSTLSDPLVEEKLENFIVVKVLQNDAAARAQLPAVQGVPTTFFITKDKTLIVDIVGYISVQDFLSYISDIEKKTSGE